MDDTLNRLAKDIAKAIAAAAASDPHVEALRAKARAAGYEVRLSLDAEVGFAQRTPGGAMVRARKPGAAAWNRRAREINANDRLFLKSLRIAPDEIPEVKG